ncbi:MAG: B12-binding domain-containing radical SAM protein [Chloroflexi bacterium]|nr:B12-binding domain-containing radical SAM protein [Chloroflexota bacterium]
MRILLVYPQYPDTFWSFKHALKFISKRAAFPPLGLLTVAAMLPQEWDKRLVDTNVDRLSDADIRWADYVFISAMAVQRDPAEKVITRCREMGVKTVAGGPLFTSEHEKFTAVDHLVLGEAEVTLPLFLEDLKKGCARHAYPCNEWPEISNTPVPLWSLIDMKQYSSMNIQYSRGCPFDCEFCDITVLNGRRPRTKSKEQVVAELEALYQKGWRGNLFVVDDNFIGNKNKLKTEILPAIIDWRARRRHPFILSTEASVNLADDQELMQLMARAGFDAVFVGIETPNEGSLDECAKSQNRNRDLVASVKRIQKCGLEVQGGFIVGFDSDPPSIFRSQIDLIQKSGIVTAMVSLLSAAPGTRLHQRLTRENRVLGSFTGGNCSLNFIPRMNHDTLLDGYRHILETIYSPGQFYQRVRTFLKEYRPQRKTGIILRTDDVKAVLRSMWFLGIRDKGRRHYWTLLITTLLASPRKLPRFICLAIYGYHFRKVAAFEIRR